MMMSHKGLVALASHEGIVPGPYRDSVGVWTYGVGHTAAAGDPIPTSMARGMPDDIDGAVHEALNVFRRDVRRYEIEVGQAVKVPITQHEFDALVSFHYNTGGIFKASLTRKLNAGDKAGAAKAFMGWKKPKEIIPRRQAEQRLFRDGEYPSGPVHVWTVTESGRVVWRAIRSYSQEEALDLMAPKPDPKPQAKPTGIAAIIAAILSIFERAK